jgi:hypothetical protein
LLDKVINVNYDMGRKGYHEEVYEGGKEVGLSAVGQEDLERICDTLAGKIAELDQSQSTAAA